MRSHRMVQQTVYGAAFRAIVFAGQHSSDAEPNSEIDKDDPKMFGASDEVLDTMTRRLKEYSCQFSRLEEAANR